MSSAVIGTSSICPTDPPAEAMPSAPLRFSGAKARPIPARVVPQVSPAVHHRPGRGEKPGQDQADRVAQSAGGHGFGRAAPVGPGAHQRLRHAPGQVVDGDREGCLAHADAVRAGQRRQEQAEPLAHTERQRQGERAGNEGERGAVHAPQSGGEPARAATPVAPISYAGRAMMLTWWPIGPAPCSVARR
jgi:hypothetical protein